MLDVCPFKMLDRYNIPQNTWVKSSIKLVLHGLVLPISKVLFSCPSLWSLHVTVEMSHFSFPQWRVAVHGHAASSTPSLYQLRPALCCSDSDGCGVTCVRISGVSFACRVPFHTIKCVSVMCSESEKPIIKSRHLVLGKMYGLISTHTLTQLIIHIPYKGLFYHLVMCGERSETLTLSECHRRREVSDEKR